MSLTKALTPVIDLVFPPRCPLCGAALSAHAGLCAACWSELAIPGAPACSHCQRPFPDGLVDDLVCTPCLTEPPLHDGVAAATIYNPASRRLVLSFKHGGRIALAPMLARLMAARLQGVGTDWLLVPVPLHRWRLWKRGYNQSAVLASEIARITGAQVVVDGLRRIRRTPSLGGLGRTARAEALEGAIAIHPRRTQRLRGAKIVLVDDVLTSGATTNACIAALKGAGAHSVVIACFARVMEEALPQY